MPPRPSQPATRPSLTHRKGETNTPPGSLQHAERRPLRLPGGVIRDARDAAYRALAHQANIEPDFEPLVLDTGTIDAREAALAHAIYDTAVRRWLTLSHVLSLYLDRPLSGTEPAMRAALLGGAAQILLLDRIPPHAAINETVEWAKRNVRRGAGGMVNAVLRKVAALRMSRDDGAGRRDSWNDDRDALPLPDGGAVVLGAAILPEAVLERYSVALSLPIALMQRWDERYRGEDESGALLRHQAMHTLMSPPVVLCTRYATGPAPSGAEPHAEPGSMVFTGTHGELQQLLRSRDDLWVQDSAAQRAVASLADLQPCTIIDYCAGQGTKTRQLRAQFPKAEIIAAEVDDARLRKLKQGFKADPRTRVRRANEVAADRELHGSADLVLLDVPCSNSGVFARRTEARYRFATQQLPRLLDLQREILSTAFPLLAPGGTLLYSTCSVEPEENEHQVAWAAERLGLTEVSSERVTPGGVPGNGPQAYTDGAFAARLQRPGRGG